MHKVKKFISLFLIITLLFGRVLVVLPQVYAVDPPTIPTAPSAPTAPTAPTAPSAPTAPTAPTAPSAPTVQAAPTNTTLSSEPTAPSVPTVSVLPTNGSDNAISTLSTSPLEPTSATANATNSLAPADVGNQTVNSTADNYSTSNDNNTDQSGTGSGTSDASNSSTEKNGSSSGTVNDPANINTGPGSENAAYENLNKKLELMNQNLAEIQNKVDAVSVSGLNSANFNTIDGKVFTGDTVATTNLMNKLNSNMTGIGEFSVFNVYGNYIDDIVFQMKDGNPNDSFTTATPTVSKNVNTGSGSTNLADASNNFTVKEESGNDAKLTNDINLQAVSGGNSASFNTGNGIIKTGNATAVGNVVNMTNTNLNVSNWLWGVVNIFGNMVGNIIMPKDTDSTKKSTTSSNALVENNNTGLLSNNTTQFQKTDNTTVDIKNTALITTNVDAGANTGNNISDANTGGGLVSSGNSNISVSDSTIANTNTVKDDDMVWMVIVNEAGKWVGKIIGSPWGATTASNALPIDQTTNASGTQSYTVNSTNNGTGSMSNNTSSYTENSDTNISTNNTATISNNIKVNSDTGNNTAADNSGAGVILTGNATSGLNIVNMANTNVIAKKFIAVLVNVMGSWLGDVVTPDKTAPSDQTTNQTTNQTSHTTQTSLPTLTPQPTEPPSQNGSSTNTPSITPPPNYPTVTPILTEDNLPVFNTYVAQTPINYIYPSSYTQAVRQVNNAKRIVKIQSQVKIVPQLQPNQEITQGRVITRGIFLSPAFAKATESSFPGTLLGGMSLKVSNSWLSIVPLALFIIILRRRKKFNLEKYLNMFLSVVL